MLVDEKESTCCGGQLVLLTGSSISNLTIPDVTVHTIAFPSRTSFIDISTSSGQQLAVDDSLSEDSSVTQSRLTSALLQVLRYNQQYNSQQVKSKTLSTMRVLCGRIGAVGSHADSQLLLSTLKLFSHH